jgi:hypothetical protein
LGKVVEPIVAVIAALVSVNVKIFAFTTGVTADLLSLKISNVAVTGVYVKMLAVAIACLELAVETVPSAVIKFGGTVVTSTPSANFSD